MAHPLMPQKEVVIVQPSDGFSEGQLVQALAVCIPDSIGSLKTVLEALDLEDVTLAGFSMGGAISIHYMARHQGAHVSKLALLGAAAPVFTQREDFPYGLPKSAVDGLIAATYADRPAMLKEFSRLFFYAPEKLSPEFHIWNLSLGLTASARATIQCAIELRDADLRQDLASITVPTAILHGIEDKICLFDLAKVLHEGIRDSVLIPFEHAGHGFYYEQRDKFNTELVRFLGYSGAQKSCSLSSFMRLALS